MVSILNRNNISDIRAITATFGLTVFKTTMALKIFFLRTLNRKEKIANKQNNKNDNNNNISDP